MRIQVVDKARVQSEDSSAVRARIFDQMGHAVGVVHLFRAACVVTGMAGENGLHLVRFMVVPRYLGHTACYRHLAHLTLPILIWATTNQHFICQNTNEIKICKLLQKLKNEITNHCVAPFAD